MIYILLGILYLLGVYVTTYFGAKYDWPTFEDSEPDTPPAGIRIAAWPLTLAVYVVVYTIVAITYPCRLIYRNVKAQKEQNRVVDSWLNGDDTTKPNK